MRGLEVVAASALISAAVVAAVLRYGSGRQRPGPFVGAAACSWAAGALAWLGLIPGWLQYVLVAAILLAYLWLGDDGRPPRRRRRPALRLKRRSWPVTGVPARRAAA